MEFKYPDGRVIGEAAFMAAVKTAFPDNTICIPSPMTPANVADYLEVVGVEIFERLPEPQEQIVPQIISMRQCQLYLLDMPEIGGYNVLDIIDGYVDTLSRKAQVEWKVSKEVWRSAPMVEQMQQMFGWSIEQMDTMFIEATEL